MTQRGFTLLEVLLCVTILGLLAGLSLPVYASFTRRNDLDVATQQIVNALRRAEQYSRAVQGDSTWGVQVQSGQATLYKGTSYASRTSGFDETITIPSSITVSGGSDVQFAKLSGAPSATASYTLTSTVNDSRTVTVNAEGMVDY